MSTSPAIQIPRWSKRVVVEFGGRDPLGLSRVAFLITDYLLKGIITQTSRARYYSFYPWCLWHIDRFDKPLNYAQFNQAFRRREAFMALSTLWQNPNSLVVGSEAVTPRLEKSKETGELDTNFKVLPSNGMGGYGQYYGGSLYQLGLTSRTEGGIEHCAEGTASKLAEAFDRAVSQTQYCKNEHFKGSTFPFEVLKKSAGPFSLDTLCKPPARQERELLRDVFFAWSNPRTTTDDILRRHTLALILHVVSQYNEAGIFPPLSNRDDYLVLLPYYYQRLLSDGKKAIPYSPPPQLEICFGFWKQFCVHQYLTQALEHLLTAVLEIAGSESSGVPLESICEMLCRGDDFTSTLEPLFGDCDRPNLLLKRIKLTEVPSELACLQAQNTLGASSKLSEYALLNLDGANPQVNAAMGTAVLCVLFAKWRNSPNRFSSYISSNAGHNLSVATVLPQLDEWLMPDLKWPTALARIIDLFVLQQHDRVMYEKGKLESCWLHNVEGRIVKDQDYSPVFRASRHWNCVRIMNDLGLVNLDEDGVISMTKEGRQALSRVLKDDANEKETQ